jgi:CubicO group peptidase (beta-lactamase class C family)
MPSTNGHATARGVARIYAALACGGVVDGVRILRADTLAHAVAEASAGHDVVLARPSRFGLGFQLAQPGSALEPFPHAFGHFGAGGAVGFADPAARLAFAYTMNQAGARWQNPRNRALIDAVRAAL